MTYDQLIYQAYTLAIRLPHLGIVNDIGAMSVYDLNCAISMMMRLLDS